MTTLILCILIPYFIGSIPFGLILTKMAGHGDIRKMGSGNIGATNVLRTGNKYLAIATLLLDGLKGFVALEAAYALSHQTEIIFLASMATLAGHILPVWLKFKGGKGVATAIGILFFLSPMIGFTTIALWIIAFAFWRYSSLSALLAFFVTTLYCAGYFPNMVELVAVITLIIFITHRQNIERLLNGQEYKWSKK